MNNAPTPQPELQHTDEQTIAMSMAVPATDVIEVAEVPTLTTLNDNQSVNAATHSAWKAAMNSMMFFASISNILRIGGAFGVAAAMALFLMDGLAVTNDLERFYTMLGLTGVLTTSGLAMLKILNEPHGSRVFISLALLSIPINFTVAGALIYSVVNFDSLVTAYPGYAHWKVESIQSLMVALVAGFVVVLPVAWFAVSVLSRKFRMPLVVGLLASCSLLLIPTRHAFWISGLVFASIIVLTWAYRQFVIQLGRTRTTEERFVFAVMLVPPLIMLGRSFWLYQSSTILFLAFSAGLFWCARQWRQQRIKSQKLERLSSSMATLTTATMGAITAWLCAILLVEYTYTDMGYIALVAGLASVVIDASKNSAHRWATRFVTITMTTMISICVGIQAIEYTGAFTDLLSLAVLISLLFVFSMKRATTEFFLLLAGIAALLISEAEMLWNLALSTGWWGIAGLGISAIIAGSLLERYGPVWKERYTKRGPPEPSIAMDATELSTNHSV